MQTTSSFPLEQGHAMEKWIVEYCDHANINLINKSRNPREDTQQLCLQQKVFDSTIDVTDGIFIRMLIDVHDASASVICNSVMRRSGLEYTMTWDKRMWNVEEGFSVHPVKYTLVNNLDLVSIGLSHDSANSIEKCFGGQCDTEANRVRILLEAGSYANYMALLIETLHNHHIGELKNLPTTKPRCMVCGNLADTHSDGTAICAMHSHLMQVEK